MRWVHFIVTLLNALKWFCWRLASFVYAIHSSFSLPLFANPIDRCWPRCLATSFSSLISPKAVFRTIPIHQVHVATWKYYQKHAEPSFLSCAVVLALT